MIYQLESNKAFMEYFEEYTNRYIPLNSILNDFTIYSASCNDAE